MKALITGASGAVGTALRAHLNARGDTIIAWDRDAVPPDDPERVEAHVREVAPDALFHLATASTPTGRDNEGWLVNVDWTAALARICREIGARFVYTGSVMAFTDDAPGPFTPHTEPDVREGYGWEKLTGERQALAKNPDAIVARIGWQIGHTPDGNQMLRELHRQMNEHGVIRASRKWYTACSFLEDTAAALVRLAETAPGGLYLIDSNTGWTYFEIVNALDALHDEGWRVEPDDSFVYDQRMIDPRANMPPLSDRLPALGPPVGT